MGKTYLRCKRCNRLLKNQKAKQLGYGSRCFDLQNMSNKNVKPNLFNHKLG